MPQSSSYRAIDMDRYDWESFFESIGEKRYRAGQVCAWLWKRGVTVPHDMTDLSLALREKLLSSVDMSFPEVVREERSKDKTRKYLLDIDGVRIECALMDHADRMTACISSQAGCPIGCPFCATGASGFERNLTCGEIAYQLIVIENNIGRPIENVVMMGMGEPMLNFDNVERAVKMLNDSSMRGLGIRHIAISTSGVVPGIRRLADMESGVRLAVSLHAPTDELRDELVPCNSTWPLSELMDAMRYFTSKTGGRITVEYSLFKDVNDQVPIARKLVNLLRGQNVFVNLIPGNPLGRFKTSPPENVMRFQSILKTAGIESEVRTPRGRDINAACGQLRLSVQLDADI